MITASAAPSLAWMCPLDAQHPEVLVDEAIAAEEAGFDAVLAPDPFHSWTDDGGAGFVWSWLGAVAARTSRIGLMTAVTSVTTRYHPAVIAQAAATIARLSGDRFTLGVGIGDPIHYLPLGIRQDGYAKQADDLATAVRAIRSLLQGEQVTTSDVFNLDHARLYSPPVAPVPIFVAASGPKSATLAASIGDGLITSVRDVELSSRRVVEPFAAAADKEGKVRPPLVATRWCILAESPADAVDALGPLRGLRVPGRGTSPDPSVSRRTADSMETGELLASWPIARDAAELEELYRPLADQLDADTVGVCIAARDRLAALRLFAEKVAPKLRSAEAERSDIAQSEQMSQRSAG